MPPRGPYRSIYTCIQDDPEFQALSPDARLVLYTLKISPLGNVAGIFVYHQAIGPVHSGLPLRRFQKALKELQTTKPDPWVLVEEPVIWIRNGLMYEPGFPMTDANKKRGVEKLVRGLPRLGIIRKFCDYYRCEAPPGPSPDPPRTLPGPSPDPPPYKDPDIDTDPDTDTDTDKGGSGDPPPAPPRSRPQKPDYTFTDFWAIWDYKTAKAQSERTFNKLAKKGKLPTWSLMKWAIGWQSRTGCLVPGRTKEGRDTRPHPSTWLNGERWNDEPDAPPGEGARDRQIKECPKCHDLTTMPCARCEPRK